VTDESDLNTPGLRQEPQGRRVVGPSLGVRRAWAHELLVLVNRLPLRGLVHVTEGADGNPKTE
jgi:hypothetical protein